MRDDNQDTIVHAKIDETQGPKVKRKDACLVVTILLTMTLEIKMDRSDQKTTEALRQIWSGPSAILFTLLLSLTFIPAVARLVGLKRRETKSVVLRKLMVRLAVFARQTDSYCSGAISKS